MTRAKLDLSDFEETPPSRDPAVLREISDKAGFPSRPPASSAPTPGPTATDAFQRPARPSGNRHIAVNTRVEPDIARMIYALRDADPTRKRAIADVIGDAIKLLYERELGSGES